MTFTERSDLPLLHETRPKHRHVSCRIGNVIAPATTHVALHVSHSQRKECRKAAHHTTPAHSMDTHLHTHLHLHRACAGHCMCACIAANKDCTTQRTAHGTSVVTRLPATTLCCQPAKTKRAAVLVTQRPATSQWRYSCTPAWPKLGYKAAVYCYCWPFVCAITVRAIPKEQLQSCRSHSAYGSSQESTTPLRNAVPIPNCQSPHFLATPRCLCGKSSQYTRCKMMFDVKITHRKRVITTQETPSTARKV
jgi:hypothetical protein